VGAASLVYSEALLLLVQVLLVELEEGQSGDPPPL
jgi:hypothetical protein